MGLKEWRQQRRGRELAKTGAQLDFPVRERSRQVLTIFYDRLGTNSMRFLAQKWRLDPESLAVGDVMKRPLSPEELASIFNRDVELTRKMDASIVNLCRLIRDEIAPDGPWASLTEWLVVPIDDAQHWWEKKWSDKVTPDGRWK